MKAVSNLFRRLFRHRIGQLTLVQVERSIGAMRCMRVVRHHDNRFPLLAIQRLKKRKNFVTRFAVQDPPLVRHTTKWSDRPQSRARYRHVAVRHQKVVAENVSSDGQANNAQGELHVAFAFGFVERREQQRNLHILLRCQRRQQIVELENEPHMTRAPSRQLTVI